MIKEDKSKRAFFKKAATVVGVIAAANYTKSLIFASADSSKNITNKYTNDADLQSKTLLQTKLVVMTDNEKNQMLDTYNQPLETSMPEDEKNRKQETDGGKPSRRSFLKNIGIASASALMPCSASANTTASPANPDAEEAVAELLQGHFSLMSDEEKKEAIARLEKRYTAKYGKKTTVSNAPALEGVLFGYALDISKCIGCRRCVHACVQENNQSRGSAAIHWIQVMKIPKGNFSFSAEKLNKGYPESSKIGDYGIQVGGNAYTPVGGLSTEEAQNYYSQEEMVPDKNYFYVPVQCQQCEKPPCIKACPVRATFRDPNGVVVIDYNWCIGCRMCQLACPYGARRFNWGEPNLPPEEMNPKTHYFGNRPRMRGVMEKCTFCVQRTREGRNPACLEACPVGARKFGNLLDPESDVRKILATKKVFRFKEEMSTYPKFFYYIG